MKNEPPAAPTDQDDPRLAEQAHGAPVTASPRYPPQRLPSRRDWFFALVVYSLLAVLYTFPLVLHLADSTLQLGANYAAMANAHVIGNQLAHVSSPLKSDRILAPVGYTIHEGFLPSLMAYLLGLGQTPLIGLNLSILFSFVFASLGAWLMAYTLTGSMAGSLAAGFFYGFCALHFANYPLYPIVHIEWIPWFFYGQLRYLVSGRSRFLCIIGLSFIASSLCSWYFTVFLLLAGSLLAAFFVWSTRCWSRIIHLAFVVGIAGFVLIPFTPYALLGPSGLNAGGFRFFVDGSADLLSLIIPPWYHWLFGSQVTKLESHWLGNPTLRGNYLGTISLGLAVWGLLVGPNVPRWLRGALLSIAAVGLVLALGPFLAIGGLGGWTVSDPVTSIHAVRLPYYWLSKVPLFGSTRATARYVLLAVLALSIGLALAVTRLEGKRRDRTGLITFWILAILLLEFWPKWPSRMFVPLQKSAVYEQLAETRGLVSVLELPFREDAYRILQCSTWHHLTVIGGAIDKPFARFRGRALQSPFLRRLLLAQPGSMSTFSSADILGPDRQSLEIGLIRDLRIEYAVIHKWDENVLSFGDYFVKEPLAEPLATMLASYFRLEREDGEVLLFKSTVVPGPWLYPTLGDGWGGVEHHGDHMERVMLGSSATVEIHSSENRTADIDLDLAVILVPERDLTILLDSKPILTTSLTRRSDPTDFTPIRLTGIPLRKGVNNLELKTTRSVPSIAEVHGGNDRRPIAFVVRRFSVK